MPKRRGTIPLWIKVTYTLFMGVLAPIYWRAYGPANFLAFCDAAALLTVAALWLESPLLAGMQAVAMTLPQTVWIADFATGGHLLGFSAYMFDSGIPLYARALSTFHIWLPFLLIWMVWRLGYDRRSAWVQSILVIALLIASYLTSDPRQPRRGYPAEAVNVNRVYGPAALTVQQWMPPLAFLAVYAVVWPIGFYLPTHLVFRRMFRDPRAGANPPKGPTSTSNGQTRSRLQSHREKPMQPSFETVEASVARIEAEMRRIGMWQDQPLSAEQLDFKQAFGGDKLSFEQWLQFVFIPRVRQIISTRGQFPSQSQVADQAFREWKMWGNRDDVDGLVTLLREFDALF